MSPGWPLEQLREPDQSSYNATDHHTNGEHQLIYKHVPCRLYTSSCDDATLRPHRRGDDMIVLKEKKKKEKRGDRTDFSEDF